MISITFSMARGLIGIDADADVVSLSFVSRYNIFKWRFPDSKRHKYMIASLLSIQCL